MSKVQASKSTPASSNSEPFRLYLQEELLERCRKNPSFSLRAFARALAVDPSTLSKILRGERPIGTQTMRKLGNRLGLDPQAMQKFLEQRKKNAATKKSAKNAEKLAESDHKSDAEVLNYQQISLDSFQVINDWYHFAILELAKTKGFRFEARWIASTLNISVAEVNAAIERLQRLQMIAVDAKTGKWQEISEGKTTTVGTAPSAGVLRRFQRQVLEQAIRALDEVPIEDRDQSTMTVAIDTRFLPEARKRIKAFRRSLAELMREGGELDRVYQLTVALFPVSK